MPLFLRNALGSRRVGTTVAVVTIALVAAGGTAAGLAITSGGSVATASAPASTTMVPMGANLPTTTPTIQPVSSVHATAVPDTAGHTSVIVSDTCFYSHEANDDPILMPGMTGQAMAHDFFGNNSTSASSTASSLRGGSSTCSTSDDASAYWTPVLYQNGVMITPKYNLVYWAGLHATDPTVTAPPAGLEMIAGAETATAPQSTRVIDWRCADGRPQAVSSMPVNCPGTRGIELRVTFPSCWDGTNLSGASETNVAYPSTDSDLCPAGFPVRIPTVIFHVVYPIVSAAGLTLSMGPNMQGSTDTAHGDFINGWDQSVLTSLISGCAGQSLNCGHVSGANADGRPRRV